MENYYGEIFIACVWCLWILYHTWQWIAKCGNGDIVQMINIILFLFGLSNAQEPTTILDLKNTAVEMAVQGDTRLLDCIDKARVKGDKFTLEVCKVEK